MNNFKMTEASIIEALRNKGFKATTQRIAICRFALNSRDHPDAATIYREVKKLHPTVSLATVYKTLQVLKGLGLMREFNSPNGQTRFDPYMKPHINLVCKRCGSIIDVEYSATKEMFARISRATRFTPTGQHFEIYGVCQKCRGQPWVQV
jgi:Fur family peroxide stress response transcriptional regulator